MTVPHIKVLLAEDEPLLASVLEQFLVSRGHAVTVVHDGRAALEAIRRGAFDVALLDIAMPEMDGLDVLRHLGDEPSPPQVIIITGNGTIETAITSIRLGAYDYLSKPYRMAEIDALVRRAWEKRELARENAVLHRRIERDRGVPEVIGGTPAMREALAIAERVAPSDTPCLIVGEVGTGKELMARHVHRLSGRSGGSPAAFVDFDCAAIVAPAMDAELFGADGAAGGGGSLRAASGVIDLAAGGTLFLDEVSALDLKTQGKLLRFIQTGTVHAAPPGAPLADEVDVRIIVATRHDLDQRIADRSFRADLLYRINAVTIVLPPLRERLDDVPLLAARLLERCAGVGAAVLSADAVDALRAYRWPGNVRELRNVIERAVLLTRPRDVITALDLPLGGARRALSPDAADEDDVSLAELERRHILAALARSSWHQGRAAAQLGISSKTLYRKIREYGFARPRVAGRS